MSDRTQKAQRDAEIVAKRKAGRTLKSIGDEYGLSRESIRRIEAHEEQREQRAKEYFGLSTRARNSVLNAIGAVGHDSAADEQGFARQVAQMGKAAFIGKANLGKKTLLELDAWLKARGLKWSPQVE
jgi:hypothetical protein